MPDRPASSSSEGETMLSPNLHEMGTRLVDMLNQVSFLHRFPTLAGVTLACINQHLDPMKQLLEGCERDRLALAGEKHPKGYAAGPVRGEDLLSAAFDYAVKGYRTFLECLAEASVASPSETTLALKRLCEAPLVSRPQAVLDLKDVIESYSEAAAKEAAVRCEPLEDLEWQKLRIEIFYFLLDLEQATQPRA